MAYQKEPYRIMAGGLNLLAPSDKPAPGDSLQLQNWRVDQSGQLRSRRGMDFQSGYLSGGAAHTLFRFSPNSRYAGVGSTLYGGPGFNNYQSLAGGFDGQPLGMVAMQDLVWIMNQARQLWHDGGVDAPNNWTVAAPSVAPSGVALSQDTTVAANFIASENWRITAPNGDSTNGTLSGLASTAGSVSIAPYSTTVVGTGTAFTAAMAGGAFTYINVDGATYTYSIASVDVGAQTLTLSSAFQGNIDTSQVGAYQVYENLTLINYSNPSNIAGSSLFIQCQDLFGAPAAGSWQVYSEGYGLPNYSLGIDGAQNDSDLFSISIWVTDPTQIVSITLTVDVNTGDFASDYYSVTIPASALSQTAFSWSIVQILRGLDGLALIESNPDYLALLNAGFIASPLAFTRSGSTPGRDWGTVVRLGVTLNVAGPVDVQLAQYSVTGGSAGTLNGDYTFYTTFDTPQGHESNPSPGSAPVTLTMQPAQLTGIQTSMDPQVTMRHIYMVGGNLSTPYRIGTIPDNVTTGPFEVTVSEQDAQLEDTTIPVSHDAAPPCLGVIEHLGRLIAFNSPEFPGRYWWSPTGQPYYFPGAADTEEGNWEDTGEDTDPILAATSHNQTLLFYKSRSVVRLFGDPATSDPELTSSTIGIVGPRALAHAGPLDYIVGAEGVYSFNGEVEAKISLAIDPIFKNEYTTISPGITVPPLAGDFASSCALEHVNGRLYFSYPAQGGGPTPLTLVCDLASGRWYEHYLDPDLNGTSGFTALYYEGQGRPLLGAVTTSDGAAVYELENQTFADDGNAIPLAWHSRYDDCGMPDVDKVYGELVIVAQTGAQASTLTVSVFWGNGASQQALGTINALGRTQFNFPLGTNGAGVTAKNIAVRIEDSITTECVIYDCYLYWYVETRHGEAFDTGVIDFGSALAKQADGLEMDLEFDAPGTLTWYLRGDLPGGTIAQRLTGQIAAPTTSRFVHRPNVAIVEGRKLRFIGVATGTFKNHGVRMRVLEIPEYVDGTAGEVWVSRLNQL